MKVLLVPIFMCVSFFAVAQDLSIEGGVHTLGRYTGKVSRTSPQLAAKLFSEDFKGVNYDSTN